MLPRRKNNITVITERVKVYEIALAGEGGKGAPEEKRKSNEISNNLANLAIALTKSLFYKL